MDNKMIRARIEKVLLEEEICLLKFDTILDWVIDEYSILDIMTEHHKLHELIGCITLLSFMYPNKDDELLEFIRLIKYICTPYDTTNNRTRGEE